MTDNPHILIVDDDAGTVDIISIILKNAGYEIKTDNSGELLFLKTGIHPQLILLDNKLGKKSGSDICMELKAKEHTKNIPIIMISAADELKLLAANACADNFLPKPFSIQDLLAVVQETLLQKPVI